MYIHHLNKNFYLKIVYTYEIENLRAITTCNRFSRILTYLGAQEGGNSELRFWIPRQFSSAPKLRDGTHACRSYRDSTGQIIRFQQEATSHVPGVVENVGEEEPWFGKNTFTDLGSSLVYRLPPLKPLITVFCAKPKQISN